MRFFEVAHRRNPDICLYKEKTILLGIIIAAGLVLGCAVRVPHNETNATIDRGYIDLQPEWRVRAVTRSSPPGHTRCRRRESEAAVTQW
jgi:hypothetical protein